MTALLVIGAILILVILLMATGASARPATPHRPALRRDIPPDPIIDPGLDPLVGPWAEEAPLRQSRDDWAIADDAPFAPGGGDFGGGGANGDWDDASDSGDDGGSSSDDD